MTHGKFRKRQIKKLNSPMMLNSIDLTINGSKKKIDPNSMPGSFRDLMNHSVTNKSGRTKFDLMTSNDSTLSEFASKYDYMSKQDSKQRPNI